MSMVVQHNLQAMNSNRMLGITTGAQSKSTEKLSSGYKINRAADDAAGLTISEKMRKQMRGLDRASTNAQDGVSAVQTAEGALTEVHSMLQRMNELAVQASNGTNSESDRKAIQDEIDALSTEIDRVAETTKFNEIYLLKGDGEQPKKEINIPAHDAGLEGKLVDNEDGTFTFTPASLEDGTKLSIAGTNYEISSAAAAPSEDDISTAELAEKLNDTANAIAGSTADVKKPGETTATTYTYQAAATLDDTALHGKVTAAVTGGKAGDEIKIGTDTYKYSDLVVNIDSTNGTTNKQVQTVVNAALGATPTWAANDTITIDDGTAAKTYQFDGTNWTNTEDATDTITISGGGSQTLSDGDKVTVTTGGTTTTFIASDDTNNANATYAAGFYKDGDYTATRQTDTALNGLIDSADPAKASAVTINGTEFKNGQEIPGGWYAADGSELNPSKLAGAEVVITPNGGTAETVTVAPEKVANIISKEEAVQKMTEALKQASSIGVDKPADVDVTWDDTAGAFTITQGKAEVAETLSFNLHVGADADMTNKISVNIDTMNSAFLGVKDLDVIGKNGEGKNTNDGGIAATYAIDAIADAIAKVSAQRSALGAVQNRLEHTIANLDNVVENTTAAESRIRDTDMAEEMVEYSKNNILAQAGQSMLAQANQSTQGVLSLLG